MAASLEKLIKDLEFENEDLLRLIKDEINQIDAMQKDISTKIKENTNLEKDIDKFNIETKSLHNQYKQNKEITDSIKKANTMLGKHSEDLKKTLKLKKEETKRDCEQHEKVLKSYSEKWERYKEVYEERPLAQVARKLKLEAASLDVDEKEILEKKDALAKEIQEIQLSKVAWKREKEDAVELIVKLANFKVASDRYSEELNGLKKQNKEKSSQLDHHCRELKETISKVESAKQAADMELRKKQLAVTQPTIQPNVASPSDQQKRKHKMPRLLTPKQFHLPKLPQFKLPKIPQMPKFPSFSRSPQRKAQPIVTPPEQVASVEKNIPPSPQIVPQVKGSCEQAPPDVATPKDLNTSGNIIPDEHSFAVPMDQSNREFFGDSQKPPLMPITPKHQSSDFSFSPGQHAEKLRLLKKSPGFVGYAQKTRPMFNKNSELDTPNRESDEATSNGFASAFSSQSQFLGSISEVANKPMDFAVPNGGTPKTMSTEKDADGFAVPKQSPTTITNFKNKTSPSNFSFDATQNQPSSFSFDSPSTGNKSNIPQTTSAFSFDSPAAGTFSFDSPSMTGNEAQNTGFSFGEQQIASTQPMGVGRFDFNNSADSANPAPNTGSMFAFNDSTDGNTSFNNDENGASMFDFSIKSQAPETGGDSNIFNFGAPSDDLGGKQQSVFSFGGGSNQSIQDTEPSAFTFKF